MPYRDRQDKIANDRARYARDGEAMRAAAMQHHWENRERISGDRKKRRECPARREKDKLAMSKYHAGLRAEMIAAYGGECSCCGEDEPIFLELGHLDGKGHEHRKEIGNGSGVTYRDLKKRGWPKDKYGLLCANCNAGQARNKGVCPHVR